jgi:predicted phage terminase large subunit-like protein
MPNNYNDLSLEELEKRLAQLQDIEHKNIHLLEEALVEQTYHEAYNSSYGFLTHSWNTFEPSEFKHGKHLAAIAEHLDACLRGEIKKLIINISPRNCLEENTLINLPSGSTKKIKNIKPGDQVLSWSNESPVATTTDTVINIWQTGEQTIYKIVLSNGYWIKCTRNHKFYIANKDQWLPLKEITMGDYLLGLKSTGSSNTKPIDIKSIELVSKAQTYDIETKQHHCFFAKNILTHNSKTSLVSKAFPAYVWLKQPEKKIINIGYSLELATGDSMATRNILQSSWWQDGMYKYWMPLLEAEYKTKGEKFVPWAMRSDSNQKHHYTNTVGGMRYAVGLEGTIYGKGGDILIADDPLNPRNAQSKTYREKSNNLLSQIFATRINDRDTAIRILIAQRLCEGDSTDFFLAQGGWEHLVIPMEWDESRRYWTCIGWTDWRTKDGELMNPARFSKKDVQQIKTQELSPYDYAAQHQQLPAPIGGGVIKIEWFKEWFVLPKVFDASCIAIDLSMRDSSDSDNTAIIVMGRKDTNYYVLDLVYGKMDILKQIEAITNICDKYPYIRTKLVEKKANGDAILSLLKRNISGLVPVEPTREVSKEQRIMSTIPEIYAGNVYLPIHDYCPQIKHLLEESSYFPRGRHDDALDAFFYAIDHLVVAVSTTVVPDDKINPQVQGRINSYNQVKDELRGTNRYGTKIQLTRSYVSNLFGID